MIRSKNTYLFVFIVLSFHTFIGNCYSQAAKKTKKNMFEVFVPICHFFDGSNTNWLLLVEEKDRSGNHIGKEVPATVGLQYSRAINQNHGLRASVYHFGINYTRPNNNYAIGEVTQRMYTMFSMGYSYRLVSYSKLDVLALLDLNYRSGHERIFVVANTDTGIETAIHKDFGATLGTRLQQHLIWGFMLSLEAKYSRILYFHDSFPAYYNLGKKPTSNIFTLQIGLGYRF